MHRADPTRLDFPPRGHRWFNNARAINEVEATVREVVPIAYPMYIEPDIAREPKPEKAEEPH